LVIGFVLIVNRKLAGKALDEGLGVEELWASFGFEKASDLNLA
jgi:hypothetical protein